ncbi:MAG: DUF3843 family protein [Bacteroidales bacterium]|nr:DUF3843 family protein [Bacteroidales bacterium]
MARTQKRIYLDRWLSFHPYKKPGPSDYYYMELSNRIKKIVESSVHENIVSLLEEDERANLCCYLACYLEDIVSETGIWRAFTSQHNELYGKDLPFYHTVNYYPDEVNLEEVYFLLWYFFSTTLYRETVFTPVSLNLFNLGFEINKLLDEEYERAPGNDRLKEFLSLSPGEEDFFVIRKRIEFIILDSYLFHFNRMECFLEIADRMEDMKEDMREDELEQKLPVIIYEIVDTYILSTIYPLLALRGKDWLAHILGRDHPLFEDIMAISEKKTGFYLFQKKENSLLYFEHMATGTVLPVTVKSYETLPDLQEDKTIMTCSFVKWKNGWWFSGTSAVLPHDPGFVLKERESTRGRNLFGGMVEQQREVLTMQSKAFLDFNKGKNIAFFEKMEQAGIFALDFMEYYKRSLRISPDAEREAVKRGKKKRLPGMPDKLYLDDEVKDLPGFVFFNPESGIELAYGFNEYIPDPDNPLYDEEKSREEAIELLVSPEISRECSLYLTGIIGFGVLSFPGEEEESILEENLDFMLRYWKSENYYTKPEITLI